MVALNKRLLNIRTSEHTTKPHTILREYSDFTASGKFPPRLWHLPSAHPAQVLAGVCTQVHAHIKSAHCLPFAQLLQGTTSAQAQVVPQKLQLFPAPANEVHALHMLIQRGVHQLQVDKGLGPDLCQELQGLPADLRKSREDLACSAKASGWMLCYLVQTRLQPVPIEWHFLQVTEQDIRSEN